MIVLVLVLRLFITYVFIVSGLSKIKNQNHFLMAVKSYQILPSFFIAPFSYLLPWVELILGIAIGVGFYLRISIVLLIFLLFLFAIALIINLIRGRKIDCGCFGEKNSQHINWNLVARDFILVTFLLLILLFDDQTITVNNLLSLIFLV